MKHNLKITLLILIMFLISQCLGLVIVNSYNNYFGKVAKQKIQEGTLIQPEISIVQESIPPEIELKRTIDVVSILVSIAIAIVIATALFFLIARLGLLLVLKVWLSFVVFICLTISFTLLFYPFFASNFLSFFNKSFSSAEAIAIPLASLLTFFKVVKRNLLAHNLTEIFIYPGLAIIFLPLLNLMTAIVLLLGISIYDIIAVWKTKYMVDLAKFQMKHLKIFTGFFVPYINKADKIKIKKLRTQALRKGKDKKVQKIKIPVHVAALGGGDVAFPMIFSGVVFLTYGVIASFITIFCATLSLFLLLLLSEKGKFYPAMPFLTGGCLFGLLIFLI